MNEPQLRRLFRRLALVSAPLPLAVLGAACGGSQSWTPREAAARRQPVARTSRALGRQPTAARVTLERLAAGPAEPLTRQLEQAVLVCPPCRHT